MQSSNQPGKISVPFAESGQKQTIPVASQVGIEDGRASYTTGFPELTRTPLAAGGVPPFGTDMNGILFALSAIQQWQSAGGGFVFDSAFAAAVGGYPKGAKLLKADLSGFWVNTVESNVANPDTGGAGWLDASGGRLIAVRTFSTPGTFTYTPSPGTSKVVVKAQGAGGGGGGCAAVAGGQAAVSSSGHGGGYTEGVFTTGFAGASFTVGAGGAGGPAGANNGSNGGSSTFGALLNATGGAGGSAGVVVSSFPSITGTGGTPGASSGGYLNSRGGAATISIAFSASNASVGTSGSSQLSGSVVPGNSQSAVVPGLLGSGGGGACSDSTNASAKAGAAGGNGVVIIMEYS